MAAVTIPIIDIGPTPGPLSIWRYLAIQAGTNPLVLGLIQEAGNSYNLPGLETLFDSNTTILAEAERVAGEYVDFGLSSGGGGTGTWELLGIVGGSSKVTDSRNIHFRPLLGGSQGIGAALYGTLSDSNYTRNLNFLGSNLNLTGDRTLADFNSATAFTPGGYRSVLSNNTDPTDPSATPPPATLIDTTPNATFNLGSLTGSAGGNGAIRGGGGLCLGSAVASCGGNISYATVGAPVTGDVDVRQYDDLRGRLRNQPGRHRTEAWSVLGHGRGRRQFHSWRAGDRTSDSDQHPDPAGVVDVVLDQQSRERAELVQGGSGRGDLRQRNRRQASPRPACERRSSGHQEGRQRSGEWHANGEGIRRLTH